MYNEYEDYMRSVLGYPSNQVAYDTYGFSYDHNNTYFPYRANANESVDNSKYENLYPEIYRILKPMITKACSNVTIDDISNDRLEVMANEIYTNVESDIDVVNVNITTQDNLNQSRNSMNVKEVSDDEKRFSPRNPILKDLIKILILRHLLNNRPNRPGRPGMPPRPPMPPHNNPMPRPPYRGELENFPAYNNQYYPY